MTLFPDVTALTVDYLTARLPAALTATGTHPGPVTVASQVPNPRPPRLVRIQATGGQLRDVAHERALLAVQCWDQAGEVQAGDLARLVTSLLRDWPTDPAHGRTVTTVTATRPYPFPDPDTSAPRFQTTAEVVVRPERT